MANDKRERQRQNKQEAVIEQARDRASTRQKQQRLLFYALIATVVVGGAIFAIMSMNGDDDEGSESATPSSSIDGVDPTLAPAAADDIPASSQCPAEGTEARNGSFAEAPELTIDTTQTINATMQTNAGSMTIELYPQQAPLTVNNFVFLAEQGYYDCLIFHRVIDQFMIQGGDPTGTGSGGPGYSFEDELPDGYEVGAMAMANSGPNTNGSQFFIVTGPNGEGLPGQYSKFGQVVDGLDVALRIQGTPTAAGDRPLTDIFIESVTIDA